MKTLLDTASEVGIRFRIKQLQPMSPARWGKTTAPRVLRHLVDVFAAPLLEAPVAVHGGLLTNSTLRWLYLQGMPCPDGKSLVAEEVSPAETAGWPAAVDAWYDACSRFVARARSAGGPPFAPHPLFGPLSSEEWGRLAHFHTDYHLRQFGV